MICYIYYLYYRILVKVERIGEQGWSVSRLMQTLDYSSGVGEVIARLEKRGNIKLESIGK